MIVFAPVTTGTVFVAGAEGYITPFTLFTVAATEPVPDAVTSPVNAEIPVPELEDTTIQLTPLSR
ncbi:hypothetical protein D3C87_1659100 [compost metagenome]